MDEIRTKKSTCGYIDVPYMCGNFHRWRSLSGPEWACWPWMVCGACYDREPWCTPDTRSIIVWQTCGTINLCTNCKSPVIATFKASRLLLISAPSRRVCRSALEVSAPLSLPARSMSENFPCIFPFRRRMIWNTAWLRDECAFADVCPDVLRVKNEVLRESNDRTLCFERKTWSKPFIN